MLNLDHESFEIVSNHRKYISKLLNMTNDNTDRFSLLYYLLEVSRLEDNRDPSSINSTIPNVLCFVSKTDRSTGRSSREKTNGCFLCCLLVTFFVTSANSSTFVLAMFSSNGDLNPTGPKKILWGILQSGLTLALMLGTSNGLQMLQTASIAVAFPFAFIMIFAMISIVKILRKDSI